MWGDRALGTRERGCMYCELGGDVCGEIRRLGHEKEVEKRRNVVYWNPNGRSSMISCAIKSFKRHSQGMSLFVVCVFVF